MNNEPNEHKQDFVYSKRLKAGKKRTYFIDIRATKSNDYFLVLTESRKRFDEDGYERHKICLYREDVNKFVKELEDAVHYLKTELLPNYDFDAFDREQSEEYSSSNGNNDAFISKEKQYEKGEQSLSTGNHSDTKISSEDVDKW